MTCNIHIPAKLADLKNRFTEHGYELWFVGGSVRDSLMGIEPKDIDLATSATPEEAIALYEEYGYSFHLTGMAHGTITVVLDHIPYEITTFRLDTETDGRHAIVEYTRDLGEDLKRRDLTMNAIAMGFDGEIFDPFGGIADIEQKKVRFVGEADDRLNEDYLRILRFFRFWGRFADVSESVMDRDAYWAIMGARDGLKQISVERVWSEVAKIISGPHGEQVMRKMEGMEVHEVIGLPTATIGGTMLLDSARAFIRNPAFLMAAFYGERALSIGTKWKWSNEEKKTAKFVTERAPTPYGLADAKQDILNGWSRDIVSAMLAMREPDDVAVLRAWVAPVFPVTGGDLIAIGIKPGPDMGKALKAMRDRWAKSDYVLSKADILNA